MKTLKTGEEILYEYRKQEQNLSTFKRCLEELIENELKSAIKTELLESNWIELESCKAEDYPNENETVWAYNANTGHVALAVYVYDQAWFWAISNGIIYNENGRIVTEAELDDDYEFTHFCRLPVLPEKIEEKL